MPFEHPIALDIWSDYACPFCYLELPFIDRLKREFGQQLEVTWHALELRPEPVLPLDPQGIYLHDFWDRSVYPMARERGMKLHLPPLQPRSRKAFEAAEHAKVVGRFDAMHHALFRAFFEEGRDIGDTETLVDVGAIAGIAMTPLKEMLDAGRYMQRVLDQEHQARKLGIDSVPLMLVRLANKDLSDALVVKGAAEYDILRSAVVHAAS